jgi:IclR family transcriptional regulator, acetate operon repressor
VPNSTWRAPSGGAKTQIRSVSRAMRLLFLAAERPDGARATEAADSRGIPVPTAYHLLNTLVAEGMLAKDPQHRYVLGPRVGVLSDAVARDLLVPHFLAAPLRALAEEAGETAYVTAWRRRVITVLDSVEGARAVKVSGLYPGCSRSHPRAREWKAPACLRDQRRARGLHRPTPVGRCDRSHGRRSRAVRARAGADPPAGIRHR